MPPRLTVCDICGQVDDHPRHVYAASPGTEFAAVDPDLILAISGRGDLDDDVKRDAIRSLTDLTEMCAHMDCCAASGRCNGLCAQALEAAGGNKSRLMRHLESEMRRLDAEREKTEG